MSWIAVDWGTTSLRGALIDENGNVLEERSAAQGILGVPAGGFPAVFASAFGDWMAGAGRTALISGMAGSRQGWVETPYCPCPAGARELADRIVAVEPGRIAMVPGVSHEHAGVPDVMRGEEVQILGAMRLAGVRDGLFVLPGTHNKWARVEHGRIMGFRTCMTGEFYALMTQHSILAHTIDTQAPLDEPAFLDGVARAAAQPGLLHNAFGARTLALFGRRQPGALASYLSGLLIGEELRCQPLHDEGPLILVGAPALTQRYALALAQFGLHARILGAQAAWAGLHALYMAHSTHARS